ETHPRLGDDPTSLSPAPQKALNRTRRRWATRPASRFSVFWLLGGPGRIDPRFPASRDGDESGPRSTDSWSKSPRSDGGYDPPNGDGLDGDGKFSSSAVT